MTEVDLEAAIRQIQQLVVTAQARISDHPTKLLVHGDDLPAAKALLGSHGYTIGDTITLKRTT